MFTSGTYKAISPNHPKELPKNWTAVEGLIHNYVYDNALEISGSDYLEYFVSGWEYKTLLYCLNNELADDVKIRLQFTTHSLTKQAQDAAASDLQCFRIGGRIGETEKDKLIDIHYIKHGIGIFGILDKQDHLEELKHVSLLLQNNTKHRVRVYKNLLSNTISVITNEYDIKMVFNMLALSPRLFEDIEIQTELVLEILKSAGNQDYASYVRDIDRYIADKDIVKQQLAKKLTHTFKFADERKLKREESNLKSIEREIKRFEEDLELYYRKRKDSQKEILMFTILKDQTDISEKINELLDFMDANKYIKNIQIHGEGFYLDFISPVKYYDKDLLETIFERNPQTLRNDKVRKFLRDVFIENKYQFLMFTRVNINTIHRHVECPTTSNKVHRDNGYPNHPHLMRHNCWGDNKTIINKQLKEDDFIVAINQITAATMGINVGDSVVFRYFVDIVEYMISSEQPITVIDNATKEEINYQDILNASEFIVQDPAPEEEEEGTIGF